MAKAVLIVDDNPLIRQALCERFKCETDFEVCGEAENGREAIEKAQQLHPDLIVLDLSMPVMNGLTGQQLVRDGSARWEKVRAEVGTTRPSNQK